MTRKFSQARKDAFLRALAESGNQALSAERARVSRSWVSLQRSTDAAFDAACRAAIGEAGIALSGAAGKRQALPLTPPAGGRGASSRPPETWRYLDGAELVVAGSNRRNIQVRRARLKQWTGRVEERFLCALAATCNVRAACAEAGMSVGSAYAHRHRWEGFANAWDAAIETGHRRLEAALVEAGCNLFSPDEFALDSPIAAMTAEQAIHLLHMHKHQVLGLGRRPGAPRKAAGNAEIARALERRLRTFRPPPER